MFDYNDLITGTLSTNFDDEVQTPVEGLTVDVDQYEIEEAAERILEILKRKK